MSKWHGWFNVWTVIGTILGIIATLLFFLYHIFLAFIFTGLTITFYLIAIYFELDEKFPNKFRKIFLVAGFLLWVIVVGLYCSIKPINKIQSDNKVELQKDSAGFVKKEIKEKPQANSKNNSQQHEDKLDTIKKIVEGIDKKIKPNVRLIDEKDQEKFVAFLSDKSKGKVNIIAVYGNESSIKFAELISKLLKNTGYNTNGVDLGFFSSPAPEGIFLRIANKDEIPPHAIYIQRAFKLIGIDAPAVIDIRIEKSSVEILVGNMDQ